MGTMYFILGVIGWAACPAAFFAYVWVGRRERIRQGFEIDRER